MGQNYRVLQLHIDKDIIGYLPIHLLGFCKRVNGVSSALPDDCLHPYDLPEQNLIKKYIRSIKEAFAWEDILHFIQPEKPSSSMNKNLKKMWNKKNELSDYSFRVKPIPSKLYRYRKAHINDIELAVNGTFRLSSPTSFNDPFDCNYSDVVNRRLKDVGILCFSNSHKLKLLYSHYADGHKGYCMEVDAQKMMAQNPYALDKDQTGCIKVDFRPVYYYESNVPIKTYKIPNELALIATSKSSEWRYEQEYRMFLHQGSKGSLGKPGCYTFDECPITGFYFGCECNTDFIKEVKRITRHIKGIFYKKLVKTPNAFNFRCKKL